MGFVMYNLGVLIIHVNILMSRYSSISEVIRHELVDLG
jgi:hypothetical protein